MKLVDLQIVERVITDDDNPHKGSVERVLQVRHAIVRPQEVHDSVGFSRDVVEVETVYGNQVWGDWEDVPVIPLADLDFTKR